VYRGDWRTAGELAYARPRGQLQDENELLAIFAIREYALRTGGFDRAIEYLYQTYDLRVGHEMDAENNLFVGVSLALLLQKKGDKAAAHTLLNEMAKKCERAATDRLCAIGHVLAGEREAALDSLRKLSKSQGYLLYWWYLIDRDPIWADIRSDPRFQAIASSLRDRAARQRVLLEQMRTNGEVPPRSSGAVRAATSH
jgi:hypothetical protein